MAKLKNWFIIILYGGHHKKMIFIKQSIGVIWASAHNFNIRFIKKQQFFVLSNKIGR